MNNTFFFTFQDFLHNIFLILSNYVIFYCKAFLKSALHMIDSLAYATLRVFTITIEMSFSPF